MRNTITSSSENRLPVSKYAFCGIGMLCAPSALQHNYTYIASRLVFTERAGVIYIWMRNVFYIISKRGERINRLLQRKSICCVYEEHPNKKRY